MKTKTVQTGQTPVKKAEHSRFEVARRGLIFWTLFIGIGAVGGALCMLLDPSGKALGMDAMLPFFQVLPFAEILFQNFVFSGAALLIVNGLTNLTATGLLLARKPCGVWLGGLFGVTLMLWIIIQFVIFPLNFMSTAYFIFGLCQAATGYAAWVFARQEAFRVNMADYPHIGTNPQRLVVFFSRMGYGKKLACEAAEKTGASLYEIKATERTSGTLGFWWCGRYGMHRWEMPIEPISVNLGDYEQVTICSPIWVFTLAAPVRAFCRQAAGKIRAFDCILVHHQGSRYENAAKEMAKLLKAPCVGGRSVQCHLGRYRVLNSQKQNGDERKKR